LWRNWPLLKWKKRRQNHSPQKRRKFQYTYRLFGTNNFKEGAIQHKDPLLDNDCEISNYTTAVPK
jgi:hypothetical protein